MDPFGIVGTGRMAQALGATLCRRGVPVAAVSGNDREKARVRPNFIGAPPRRLSEICHFT